MADRFTGKAVQEIADALCTLTAGGEPVFSRVSVERQGAYTKIALGKFVSPRLEDVDGAVGILMLPMASEGDHDK